ARGRRASHRGCSTRKMTSRRAVLLLRSRPSGWSPVGKFVGGPMRGTLPRPPLAAELGPEVLEQVDPTHLAALRDVYLKHRERIYRYCRSLLKNPDDAEDATQETFIRSARQLPRLTGDLSAYITTVARNVCCDMARERARKGVSPLDPCMTADEGHDPETAAIRGELARTVWARLSTEERAFFAHAYAGFRHEEIAKRTGRSVPAVSVGIFRARQRVKGLAGGAGAAALLALNRLWRRATQSTRAAIGVVAGIEPSAAISLIVSVAAIVLGASPSAAPVLARDGAPIRTARTAEPPATATDGRLRRQFSMPAVETPQATTPAQPTGQGVVVPMLGGAIPGHGSSPQDVQFTSISDPPTDEGSVFASGQDLRRCPVGGSCPVLFTTSDGGASWRQRAGVGFTGGQVMIPAGDPTDPAIFVAGPHGLAVGRDGATGAASPRRCRGRRRARRIPPLGTREAPSYSASCGPTTRPRARRAL